MSKLNSFGNRCFLGLVLGFAFGMLAPRPWVASLSPYGSAFEQLLKMAIIPVIFVYLVNCFSKVSALSTNKALIRRTLFWFFLTSVTAAILGLVIAGILNPALGLHTQSNMQPHAMNPSGAPFGYIFTTYIVPGNILQQVSQNKLIPLIVFAFLFGAALTLSGKEMPTLKSLFKDSEEVAAKITTWVLQLAPIGVFIFIAQNSQRFGWQSLFPFLIFILALLLACLLQIGVYCLLLLLVAGQNPLTFLKKAGTLMFTAFTTSSSNATLPLTIDTLENKFKLPESLASFVASFGALAKRDGSSAIYPAILCVFVITMLQAPLLWEQYALIILLAALISIGTAGVPYSAIISATIILTALGLPLDCLILVIGIDRLIDKLRTVTNVTGTAACAILVASKKGALRSV